MNVDGRRFIHPGAVVAPAQGQSVAFQLPVRTSQPAYAFRYEWR